MAAEAAASDNKENAWAATEIAIQASNIVNILTNSAVEVWVHFYPFPMSSLPFLLSWILVRMSHRTSVSNIKATFLRLVNLFDISSISVQIE